MNEPRLPRHDHRPSGLRLIHALVLGHLAGAYAFVGASIVFGLASKLGFSGLLAPPASNPTRWLEGLKFSVGLAGIFGMWTAIAMVPLTVLVLPIAWLAARRLRTGLWATMALGAATGLLPALIVFQGASTRDIYLFPAAAVAGAVFASVIWVVCIWPRLRALNSSA